MNTNRANIEEMENLIKYLDSNINEMHKPVSISIDELFNIMKINETRLICIDVIPFIKSTLSHKRLEWNAYSGYVKDCKLKFYKYNKNLIG